MGAVLGAILGGVVGFSWFDITRTVIVTAAGAALGGVLTFFFGPRIWGGAENGLF